MRFGLFVTLLCLPNLANASLQISEIAWMGGIQSANHEWIELHNTGPSVSVDGWILHDANNLTIELTGTVPANSYVVLERTSDDSAPGEAFLVYTGALANTGATLVLRNAAGVVVDQVIGGDGWQLVGGDNTTKHTAQRTSSGWQTLSPTPGQPPTAPTTTPTDTNQPATIESTPAIISSPPSTRSSGEPTILTLPDISLQLTIDVPTKTHVGQPVALSVTPSGVGPTIANSLTYTWSLGNGEERTGQDSTYTFMHPGQYVVVVSGVYKRQTQFARQTVEVLPVSVSITQTANGTYAIHNDSDQEINLGGYRLVGNRTHTFPAHTIILPEATVVTPLKVTQRNNAVVALYDQTNEAVAMHLPGYQPPTVATNVVLAAAPVGSVSPRVPTPPASNFTFATNNPPSAPPQTPPPSTIPTNANNPQPLVAAAATVPNNPLSDNWPLFALILLLILGIIGIYLVPHKKDDPPWV